MENTFDFADNVLGIMVSEEIDEKKTEEILSLLKERLKSNSKVSLYLEDQFSKGISLSGFMKAIAFHYSHSDALRKFAVVSNSKSFRASMDLKSFFAKAETKTFKTKDRMEAMNWVMQ